MTHLVAGIPNKGCRLFFMETMIGNTYASWRCRILSAFPPGRILAEAEALQFSTQNNFQLLMWIQHTSNLRIDLLRNVLKVAFVILF